MKRTVPKKNTYSTTDLLILFLLFFLIPITVGVVLLQTRYFSRAAETPSINIPNNTVNVLVDLPSSLTINQQYDVPIVMNTNSNEIVGIDFVITYNPQNVELLSGTSNLFSQRHDESNDKTSGVYKLTLNVNHAEPPVNGSNLIPLILKFTTKKVGSMSIGISPETITAGPGVTGQNLIISSQPAVSTIYEIIPTSTPSIAPTPTPVSSVIPNAPSWFSLLPVNLRGFLEQLYLTVYIFQRQTNLRHLLEGVFN